jgi:hypothetical protein
MQQLFIDQLIQIWQLINRAASYASMNLLDDPAMLAIAFC